jgi:hypothetical protein
MQIYDATNSYSYSYNDGLIDVTVCTDEMERLKQLSTRYRELDGAIWFVSLLSRVDGLVLMNSDLEVRGFGVEITCTKKPMEVFVAEDLYAAELRKVDYNHFGTRHRSMMRYCAQVPGSLGFVISQDGDIRAMIQIEGELIIWDNIALHTEDFDFHRRLLLVGDELRQSVYRQMARSKKARAGAT